MTQINPGQPMGLPPVPPSVSAVPPLPPLPPGNFSPDAYLGGGAGPTPGAPAAPGPSALPAPVFAPLTPELQALAAKFRSHFDMGTAAVELAKLPSAQAAAVAVAVFQDPLMDNDKALNLIATVLTKRVREPGMVEALRVLHRVQLVTSRYQYEAKLKAAIAMLHFGTPSDLADTLRLLSSNWIGTSEQKVLLIRAIASKPEALAHPATLDMLIAVMKEHDITIVRVAVAQALGRIKSPKARDAIGESPVLTYSMIDTQNLVPVLEALAQHPAPYTPLTVHHLRKIARDSSGQAKELATSLLKRTGEKV